MTKTFMQKLHEGVCPINDLRAALADHRNAHVCITNNSDLIFIYRSHGLVLDNSKQRDISLDELLKRGVCEAETLLACLKVYPVSVDVKIVDGRLLLLTASDGYGRVWCGLDGNPANLTKPSPLGNTQQIGHPFSFWTPACSERANEEGWNLFETDGAVCIQKSDEAGRFTCDQSTLNTVLGQAAAGSKLHMLAVYLDGRCVDEPVDIPLFLQDHKFKHGFNIGNEATVGDVHRWLGDYTDDCKVSVQDGILEVHSYETVDGRSGIQK